ncbi:MAG TPA: PilZ domain-containing protein [Terriglobales bacterium]|nr:PilZ domain-containing protein [Terriglobales bacterium]
MTLSSMVVSRDWQEISVLECILGSLQIGVDIQSEPEHAWAKLSKSKIDALIVDRDLRGTDNFLRQLQQYRDDGSALPLIIVGGSRGRHNLTDANAVFSFEKPISVEQAVHTLSAARSLILDGRLRYHRQVLDLPISLTCGQKKKMEAQLVNLSQGGMGIHLDAPLEMRGPVQILFELPGARRAVKAAGEIAWTDQRGNAGIRFVEISQRLRRDLQLWLERRYFLE